MFGLGSRKLTPDLLPQSIHTFVGFSNNAYNRLHGSSGGIGTTVLQYLLDSGKVDAVIGVGFDDFDRTKCIYKLVEKSSEVTSLTGSKYVYMSLPPLLKILEQNKHKKLAVVVEPCFVRAVKKLAPQCVCVISFFCGYNITPEATDYLIRKARVKKSEIYAIEYRGGKYPGGFTVHLNDGQTKSFGKEHWELVDLLFHGRTCGKCQVFISQEADLVLGDAWIKNLKNATLLLVNTPVADQAVSEMFHKHLLTLYDIDQQSILKMHAHNLKFKNFGHSYFMKMVVKIFNNRTAPKIAPFHLLGFMSRMRRAIMVGTGNMNLISTQKYNSPERITHERASRAS